MDKIKSHHSTSFFVDQLLNMSMPKLAFDEKPNKPANLSAHLPINHQSTSLTHSLSLIGNRMAYDRQTLNQLNGKFRFFDSCESICKKNDRTSGTEFEAILGQQRVLFLCDLLDGH